MRFLSFLAALVLFATPALAQRIIVPSAPSGSQSNPNGNYESSGQSTSGIGAGTSINSGSSNNTFGTPVTFGPITNAWSGFWIYATNAGSAASRFVASISFDGGTTYPLSLFYSDVLYGSGPIFIPKALAAGSSITIKLQSSGANNPVNFALSGQVAGTGVPPGFTTCETVNSLDLSTTRPSVATYALTSNTTGWLQLVASTAHTYGALILQIGDSTVAPVTAQPVWFSLGQGTAGSETTIKSFLGKLNPTNPITERLTAPIAGQSVASGTRLAIRALAATPGTDAVTANVIGCY